MTTKYFRTNEIEATIDALNQLGGCLERVRGNVREWPGAIMWADAAAMAALVAFNITTQNVGHLKERDQRKVFKAIHEEKEPEDWPRPDFVADFPELLERALRSQGAGRTGERLELSCGTKEMLGRLRNLRGDLYHVEPAGWSIEIDLFPPAIDAALELVDSAMKSRNVLWSDEDQESRFNDALSRAVNAAASIRQT